MDAYEDRFDDYCRQAQPFVKGLSDAQIVEFYWLLKPIRISEFGGDYARHPLMVTIEREMCERLTDAALK